ncbi:UL16-binding protein 3 isoform X5 [Myotis daubentonii]|uniref:UL16-binding protein 3 isoform X5 n=1 Tax=Myotis daubentonii TaxID=98922 RepID=UPI002873E413|nr:UL16-binding protein 3 isoform X5 [Myotis daubentonii]
MERIPGSEFCLVVLLLAVLPDCARGTPCAWGRGDARSLCYQFNITPKGQPWCKIQGQFNGNTFLNDTCGSEKFEFISIQEMKVNERQAWNEQTDTLKYVLEELKKILLDIVPEMITARGTGPLSLQGSMMCKQESSGRKSALWEFRLDGQKFLLFDATTESWIWEHPQSGPLRKALDGDRKLLVTISLGDCVNWLQQVSETQGEVLDSKAAPITVPAPATTTPNIASASPAKTTDQFKTWTIIPFVSVIVTVLIILCIIGYHYRKRSQKMLTCCWECGLVQKVSQLFGCLSISSCSPVDLQELPSLQQMQRLAEGREDTADAMLMSCSP